VNQLQLSIVPPALGKRSAGLPLPSTTSSTNGARAFVAPWRGYISCARARSSPQLAQRTIPALTIGASRFRRARCARCQETVLFSNCNEPNSDRCGAARGNPGGRGAGAAGHARERARRPARYVRNRCCYAVCGLPRWRAALNAAPPSSTSPIAAPAPMPASPQSKPGEETTCGAEPVLGSPRFFSRSS
jgi:hypothetical protein